MNINGKLDWIRGFLESLEYSDNITKQQITLLKTKLREVLDDVNYSFDDEDEYTDFHGEDESEDEWDNRDQLTF